MLMVGGGAVNFHGYQRHSADVGFWIETTATNFDKLAKVFNQMGNQLDDFPKKVKEQRHNISIKFSTINLNLELITNFSIGKTFEEAFKEAEVAEVEGNKLLRWHVLSLDDLITSKIKSSRPKYLLDVQKLKKGHNLD
jgi:hypothetical protein